MHVVYFVAFVKLGHHDSRGIRRTTCLPHNVQNKFLFQRHHRRTCRLFFRSMLFLLKAKLGSSFFCLHSGFKTIMHRGLLGWGRRSRTEFVVLLKITIFGGSHTYLLFKKCTFSHCIFSTTSLLPHSNTKPLLSSLMIYLHTLSGLVLLCSVVSWILKVTFLPKLNGCYDHRLRREFPG